MQENQTSSECLLHLQVRAPHANRWFPCHRGVFYPFIRVNTTRTVRQFGSDSPVVSLKKTGVLPNQLLWDLRQMRYE